MESHLLINLSNFCHIQNYWKIMDLSGERRAAGKVRLTRNGNADTSKQEVSLAGARGSLWKLAGGESLPACTVHAIYRIATHFIFQITFKFVW